MATARREYFGYLIEPGLRKIFYNEYNQVASMIGELYNVQTSSNPYEDDVGIGAMSGFPLFEGTVEYDDINQGYKKTYEFPEYAKGFKVERKLFDDERYGIINKRPAGLAIEAARRREQDAAALFMNAFSDDTDATDYLGGDDKNLCATDHTSTAADGPSERSNAGTSELGHSSLQATKLLMRDTRDDRSGRISVVPDTLLVGPELEELSYELVKSDKVIDSSNHNPSIHEGRYRVLVWDEITDDRWFMIDSHYMKMFLNWFDRVPLEFAMAEEFDTLVAKFRAYMRYACGFSDWIWVYGNKPS
jgi:phage major head subunit gpT-like protein